jgi:hypothetical protein
MEHKYIYYTGLRLNTFFENLALLHVFLCAEIQNDTVAYHVPFFSQNQIFILYQSAQFISYTNIK